MAQVSSVGELGITERSDERMYYNFPELVTKDNVAEFQDELDGFLSSKDYRPEMTRSVVRAVIDVDTTEELLADFKNFRRVEAGTPLPSESGRTEECLVYFASNRGPRHNSSTFHQLNVNAINSARELIRNQDLSSGSTKGNEYEGDADIVDVVEDPAELQMLWGKTFGWTLEGCQEFAEVVESGLKNPKDRNVWFKGVKDMGGTLIAAAMAERLDMPSSGHEGRIALVEHTEWAALPGQRGRGLGKLVVRSLTQTLREDLSERSHLIFAECNILSGAHIVALRSGFDIPELRSSHGRVGQVLHSNVRIGDGLEPQGEYRNFMFTTVV
jgi:hypothetical protein